MFNPIKWLLELKAFKAYSKSLNTYLKNPLVFIPFALENLLPIIITSTVILIVMGAPGIDYYYNPNVFLIADPLAGPKLFFSLMVSAVIGAFIISYFDAAGLSLALMSIKQGKVKFNDAWTAAKGLFFKQVIVFLLLALTGIGLIFPLLFFITFGISPVIYVFYSFFASVFYLLCILYPRIISVVEPNESGFQAFFKGIKFSFTKIPHVMGILLVVFIVFSALSLISLLSPQVYYLVFLVFLFPWINIMLMQSYLIHSKGVVKK